MARDGMRDVRVEDDEPTAGGAPGHGDAQVDPRRPRPHRRPPHRPPPHRLPPHRLPPRGAPRRVLAAGAAGLVALVAVVSAVDGWQARRHAARVAALPGVVAPLDGTLAERWRRPGGHDPLVTLEGDPLLRTEAGGPGAQALVRVDVATGTDRWSAPLPELTATGDLSCAPLGDPGRAHTTHVACRLVSASEPLPAGGRRSRPGSRSVLVVLDAATGERVRERPLGDRWTTLTGLGRDLVRVQVQPDRRVQVRREDPLTGRPRWTVTSTRPVVGPLPRGSEPATPVPEVQHGVVVTDGTVGLAVAPDGTRLGEWSVRGTYLAEQVRMVDVTVLPDRRLLVAEPLTPGSWVRVSSAGSADRGFPGPVVDPVVDDGSGDGLVLTWPDHLVAVDTATGRPRWRAPEDVRRGDVLRLDRRVVVPVDGGVAALDARTGELLWRTDVPAPLAPRLVTDGRVVLVPAAYAREPHVVALGIEDGRERWRAPLPPGVEDAWVVGGHLLGITDDEIIALG